MIVQILSVIFLLNVVGISGNGRLIDPPARSSAWRENPLIFPMYQNDDKMSCGGPSIQWRLNNGKCGICGEEYSSEKYFEKNGKGYKDYVVRSYEQGETIKVTIELTKNLLGYFEFRVCNVDKLFDDANQECLDQNLLTTEKKQKKFYVGEKIGKIEIELELPKDLTCDHCVFQWKYVTGNAIDPITEESCLACNNQIEQFFESLKRLLGYKNFSEKKISLAKRDWELPVPPLAPEKKFKLPPEQAKSKRVFNSENFEQLKRKLQTILSKKIPLFSSQEEINQELNAM